MDSKWEIECKQRRAGGRGGGPLLGQSTTFNCAPNKRRPVWRVKSAKMDADTRVLALASFLDVDDDATPLSSHGEPLGPLDDHRLLSTVPPHLRRSHCLQPHRLEHCRAQRCVIISTFPPRSITHRARRSSEYRNTTITRIFGGNVRYGCYFLAVSIFTAGMVRDGL